jgi:hypothetical protein
MLSIIKPHHRSMDCDPPHTRDDSFMQAFQRAAQMENAMHGHIGDRNSRIQTRGDLDFYYCTRAALFDTRRIGSGSIDYDFYRAQARDLQRQTKQRFLKRLAALTWSLLSSVQMPRADSRDVIVPRHSAAGDVQTQFRGR